MLQNTPNQPRNTEISAICAGRALAGEPEVAGLGVGKLAVLDRAADEVALGLEKMRGAGDVFLAPPVGCFGRHGVSALR